MKNVLIKLNKNIISMSFLFLSFALITSCGNDDEIPGGGDPDPSDPTASFTSQVDADNSLTYSFENNSVVNGITDTSFDSAWDFGGDGTSSEATPTYTFSDEGTYVVSLTITASDGETDTVTETIEVTAPKNRYASMTDMDGELDPVPENGELRYQLMDSIRTGRVTFNYRVTEGTDGTLEDGFINVSGTSTTGDFAIVEVRLKDNAPHEYREGADDATIGAASFPEGMPDVWVPIEISWAADGVGTPTFSLSINGQVISTDALSTTNGGAGDVDGHLAATMDGAANFQWKYSDKNKVSDGMFHVDDIVIYSSDSGSEVVVFEDDFQGRTAGDSLIPADNPDSPYHTNTFDASVGEDQ